jgi:hypothetical protein
MEDLWKRGLLQACPLCRAALPAGPEKLFEDATRMYLPLKHKVECGKVYWHSLTAPQQKIMNNVGALWVTAANQGHASAQFGLSVIYSSGEGIS